jgi:hypothetical protein
VSEALWTCALKKYRRIRLIQLSTVQSYCVNSFNLQCKHIRSCLFVWKDLTQLNYKSADLFRLRETTAAWSNRVREMEGGAGLDSLRPAALKKLLSILKVRSRNCALLCVLL